MNCEMMMEYTYWHKQQPGQPLFPDLLWSRPENKRTAGKLLIIGGNLYGFNAPAAAYAEAAKAGIGTARVLLPSALQKTVSKVFPEAEYVPSTPSGSFAKSALAELLDMSLWADGVLLAGNFGKNSETAVLLEALLQKYTGQITLTGDSVDYFLQNHTQALERSETSLVLDFAQAQKLFSASGFPRPLTSDVQLTQLVEALHEFTLEHAANIVFTKGPTVFVGVNGQVSTTTSDRESLKIAAHAATWWLQNPSKAFEALSVSLL
jgi:hypothetical protein